MEGRRSQSVSALFLVLGVATWPQVAEAADIGGDCCSDLEERVAELEATTVRKGNNKVSLTLYDDSIAPFSGGMITSKVTPIRSTIITRHRGSALRARQRSLETGPRATVSKQKPPTQTRRGSINLTMITRTTR